LALTAEKKKQILAGVLGVVLVGVIAFQFLSTGSGNDSTTPANRQQVRTVASPTPVSLRPAVARDTRIEQIAITQPLPLELLGGRHINSSAGRNIFIYPTPTPPPPPKPSPTPPPPPPPPITIAGLSPSWVIARTKEFSLTVMGAKIPRDAVTIMNGQTLPTAFISESQLKVTVPAAMIRTPGDLKVEVRSQSDSSLYSNSLMLNIAQPPVPPYLYVALIINTKGVSTAVLKSQAKGELIYVHQGDMLDRKWKVVTIGAQSIDIQDVEYNIPHTVGFTGEQGG
jgi:hypothetical protein